MLKFTVRGETVLLDPNIVVMDEFMSLYRFGEKKEKGLGSRYLLYVFYCCDLTEDNPMRSIDYRQKPEQAMARAFKKKKTKFTGPESKLVDPAIDCYNYFNETSAERAVIAMDHKIDEARTMLEKTEIQIVTNVKPTGEIGFVSNEGIIGNLAAKIGELMNLKIAITNAAKKLENSGRVRGGKGSSLAERGSLIRDNGKKKE